jgi:undecaprenyl-diphosphatase|tara:strand:- start:343 stop:1098 length:756 start_codon:yes stop_codon:yes gene_type:complete
MLEIIILSAIQGVTEFIPISSSAHLILVSEYFEFNNLGLTLDVSLHLGSLLAIIFYFRKDVFNFVKNENIFLKVLISSVPTLLVGYLLIHYSLIDYLRGYKLIGWTTIIFGILLYFSDLKKKTSSIKNNYKLKTALIIGFFQILSLVPGVSRSGITITGARFFGFSRVDSVKISFLMSIPVLAVITIYNLKNIIAEDNLELSIINLISVIFSFTFSYLTIKFFLDLLRKFSLTFFVIYRVILGLIILVYAY